MCSQLLANVAGGDVFILTVRLSALTQSPSTINAQRFPGNVAAVEQVGHQLDDLLFAGAIFIKDLSSAC